MENLEELLNEKNFFNYDKNTSEVDGVNSSIIVPKNATLEEKLKAIDLCALVGFKSTALDLPIVKITEENESLSESDLNISEVDISDLTKNFISGSKVVESAKRDKLALSEKVYNMQLKDLEDISSLEKGLLIDTDNDFLADEINAKIVLAKDCSNQEFVAACNIATIFGLNSLGCNIPLACSEDELDKDCDKIKVFVGKKFKNRNNNNFENNISVDRENNSLIISGNNDDIIETSEFFCKNYEYLIKENEVSIKEFKRDIVDYLKPQTNTEIVNIFEKEYNFDWEVNDVKEIFKDKLSGKLSANDDVEVKILVSEEKEIRDDLKEFVIDYLDRENIKSTKCNVFCSYKQGLSWITEEIIPQMKEKLSLDNIGKIDLYFKPFLPEGKTTWNDEDGSIPNIDASRSDDPEKFFDLPIRLVQELFPVDDLIEKEIGLSRDNIDFKMLENGNTDYEFIVYDKSGQIIYKDVFDVEYSERPYLDEFPGIGKVHPNTGLVEVKVNGEIVLKQTVKTDVERMWDVFQSEILEDCKKYILDKSDGKPIIEKQPFFNTLRLEILTSEPDYKLDVRQDIISVLSALHEDMYFAGLDFFKTLGIKTVGQALEEPGLILPIIKKRNGQGTYMKATLEVAKVEEYDRNSVTVHIDKVYVKEGLLDTVYVDIKTEDTDSIVLMNRVKAIEDKILPSQYGFKTLHININGKDVEFINSNRFVKQVGSIDIRDMDIPQDRVIGYDEYIDIVDKLKKVDGIKVWKASKSYQNRDIYAIEITKEYKSSIVSRTKLINNKPVFQINNRHHANEISSTNSAFLLLEQLLQDEKYRSYLDKLNIVMIPFENVDGGYIHYELQKDNPEWQLHIARFNSVGKEFARDYFKEDSKYTESRALTKLWYKWLPDILVDNHGVPKHEWDQQFSGYTSPWFKGFWLPRALFYGYFWYLDSEKYPDNRILSEALQDVVSDQINADKEIEGWNLDWQNRFEKYAHQWMPKLFPANYYKDLIYYWIPYQPDPNAWHVSHRYPWITALDWTTEVSDETAQGEYLDLCSRTHNISDIATIDMMANAKYKFREDVIKKDNQIVLKNVRIRPIQV